MSRFLRRIHTSDAELFAAREAGWTDADLAAATGLSEKALVRRMSRERRRRAHGVGPEPLWQQIGVRSLRNPFG